MTDVARRVVVRGRVQGVGFRYFVTRRARALGLTGWVRNLADGSVEALCEGPDVAVAALLEQLRSGPRLARVDDLEEHAEVPSGEHEGFVVAS